MPWSHPLVAKLTLALTLAMVAPAAASDQPEGDSQPGVAGAAMVQASGSLGPSPDAHIDVASVRGIQAEIGATQATRARAATTAATEQPAGKSVDLRVLLLSADGTEPTFNWWKTALTNEGVPFDAVIASTAPPLTAEGLRAGVDHGRYQSVVLATGGLAYSTDGGFTYASALTSDEWATLQAYEKEFAVREVDAYSYPQAAFGLTAAGDGRDMSGVQAHVTAGGASVFADLVGPVPIDRWSWGYEGAPVAGSSWQTLVSDDAGAITGSYVRDDGVEALVNTVDTNEWSIHGHALFQGMLEWATRGVHLGMHRNYFRLDVDDLFLPDDRWSMTTHATPEDDSSTVRMGPSDVDRAVAWEHSSGISLNFLFNGDGASPSDPLTQALLAHKGDFVWENHTFTHPDLDPASLTDIESELRKNIDFGRANGLNFDPTEVVTGGHSGLANPDMPQALADVGIRFFGADASRQPDQYPLGGALSVPRHPTGIYYNVGTRDEELDEYNWINFTACPSGNLGCLTAPADWRTFVDNEASMILRHILDDDPRPHYVHQSNLAEDGTMYPVIDEVLARYRRLFKPDLVQPTLSDSGRQLQRMTAWRAAVAAGDVSGTITGSGQVVITATTDIAVPVTGTEVGTGYGGATSGWGDFSPGSETVGSVPVASPPPSTDPTPPPSTDPTPPPSTDPTPPPPSTDPGTTGDGSYSDVVSQDSPIAFWWLGDDGEGNSSFSDTAGGHTGFWRNGPAAFSNGIDGDAADFWGGPLYGEVNGVTAPASAYTLEAWVWPNSDADMTFVEHGGAGALGILDGHITFRQVSLDVSAPDAVQPDRWYHVVGSWDASTGEARLYLDGQLVATGLTQERPSGVSTLYVGRGAMAGFMDGALDDIAYYATSLSSARIADHNAAGRAAMAAAPAPTESDSTDDPPPSPQSDAPDSTRTATTSPSADAIAPPVVSAASSKSGRPGEKGHSKKTSRRRHRPQRHKGHARAKVHSRARAHR